MLRDRSQGESFNCTPAVTGLHSVVAGGGVVSPPNTQGLVPSKVGVRVVKVANQPTGTGKAPRITQVGPVWPGPRTWRQESQHQSSEDTGPHLEDGCRDQQTSKAGWIEAREQLVPGGPGRIWPGPHLDTQLAPPWPQAPTPVRILTFRTCCCRSSTKWRLTLCDPVDCSTPGSFILHHHPEFAQTHVH